MVLSVSASSVIPSLSSSTRVGPTSASSSTKLQFPFRTRLLRIGTRRLPASSRPRFLPLKIQSFGSEILKIAPMVIDVVVKLCKTCSELITWEACDEKQLMVDKPINVGYAINFTKYAIEKLSQIGVLAANNGGNSVNILNVSWKGVVSLFFFFLNKIGVVSLFQIGGGHFTEVNVANIVLSLLSLITEPLKCAAETWSSSPNETISVTDAKRIFVAVHFT